jgi:pseudouridine synthase
MEKTVRLDSYLARLGIASRRSIASVLREQQVTLNGNRVKEHGVRINPEKDHIHINGKQVTKPQLLYFLVYKPKGYISTADDEQGRKTVVDLITSPTRIYPVGRLDKDSHGIMLLTNDGDLSNKLIHPKYHVPKTYEVLIRGYIGEYKLNKLRTGVKLYDGTTLPADVKIIKQTNSKTLLQIVLYEGKKRQIRRMCEALELPLIDLKRVKFGTLHLGKLQPGNYRSLTKHELQELKGITNA